LPGRNWRFAVLTGKKLGSAVLRNRHKRWARESFRRLRADLPVPGEMVIRILQPAQSMSDVRYAIHEAYQLVIQAGRRSH